MERFINSYKSILICLVIFIVTAVVYWQVTDFDFINFDDNHYVTKNTHIKEGFTKEGLLWAFSIPDKGDKTYWHPLTWISHMLDSELYGLNAGMHHLTNLLLHIVNALLLFTVLMKMSNAVWRSAFVALVFALHPVNAESVAWIAERKNLLSTFFWLLTMLAYTYYVNKPHALKYLLVIFIFLLGLLSKPMLVTLPCVLLLMDYWPLGRTRFKLSEEASYNKSNILNILREQRSVIYKLIMEKIPFLVFSFISIYISCTSLKNIGIKVSSHLVPMNLRIANALVSYLKYIYKMIWPFNLSYFYPYPEVVPYWKVVISVSVLAIITAACFKTLKKYPYFTVGWLWYLGTLVPVLGIVQAGLWPAIADRWAYVPNIGLFIIIVWVISDLIYRLRFKHLIITVTASLMFVFLMLLTWQQASHWRNNFTLHEYAISVNPGNYVSYSNLGNEFMFRGEIEKAIEFYYKSLAINSNYISPLYNLGCILLDQGNLEAAYKLFSKASLIDPDSREISNNIGAALVKNGQKDEAFKHFLNVVEKDPDNAFAYNNLGVLLIDRGMIDDAIDYFSLALQIDSEYAEAHKNLAILLERQGRIEDSIRHFLEVVRIDSENEQAHYNLGTIFLKQGYKAKASNHFREVLRINPESADSHYAYGVCLNDMEQLDEAVFHFQEAIRLNNNFEQAWRMLNITSSSIKKIDMAIFQVKEMLEKDPMNLDLLHKTAVLHKMKGDFDNALRYLQRMSEIQAGNPEVLYNIACIYSKQNNVHESLNYLKKAIDNGFDNWDVIREDSDLDNIRDSEQFNKMVPQG